MAITVLDTLFGDAKVFVPDVFEDDRGFFKETYSTVKYRALGGQQRAVADDQAFRTYLGMLDLSDIALVE